jgi:cytochrome b561
MPRPIRPPYLIALRTAITVQTATTFAAAIAAGLLLSVPGGKALHSATSYTLFVVAVLHVVVAVLAWHPGGGPVRPVWSAVVFLLGVSAQVALGLAHLKALHVPLGVLLFGLTVVQLVWVWTYRAPAVAPDRAKEMAG